MRPRVGVCRKKSIVHYPRLRVLEKPNSRHPESIPDAREEPGRLCIRRKTFGQHIDRPINFSDNSRICSTCFFHEK